ncbi:MAG: hypothetical protein M0P63_09130, partial [Azoarcus sp.]|nr:hypothetical protein [Azoarcus sp.]
LFQFGAFRPDEQTDPTHVRCNRARKAHVPDRRMIQHHGRQLRMRKCCAQAPVLGTTDEHRQYRSPVFPQNFLCGARADCHDYICVFKDSGIQAFVDVAAIGKLMGEGRSGQLNRVEKLPMRTGCLRQRECDIHRACRRSKRKQRDHKQQGAQAPTVRHERRANAAVG